MNNRDSRDMKYLSEFELVNNTNGKVYVEKDVYIKPEIGKNGMIEYYIYDLEKNLIGVVDNSKKLKLDAKYKDRKSIEKDGEIFDFDTQELEADIVKMIERQKELERIEKRVEDIEDSERSEEITEQENIEIVEEEIEQSEKTDENEQTKITEEELTEQGYNITTWTAIKDQKIIDSMISNGLDPRSIIVAEVDGDFKFLGKEIGTGEIKELVELPGGDKNAEEVNKINGNVQYEDGRGTTMVMPDYGNMEFNIEKNSFGQIEVGIIQDFDGDGKREVIPVETDIIHPTMEEYKRAEYEKYQQYGYNVDMLMTDAEIDERLGNETSEVQQNVNQRLEGVEENPKVEELETMISQEKEQNKNAIDIRILKIRNKIVRDMVQEEVNSMEYNLSPEELEEIIERCDNEYAQENREPMLIKRK